MEHMLCRNCGNSNVYANVVNDDLAHYDCLDCDFKWSAPPVYSGRVLFNIVAGFVGLLLILLGLSMRSGLAVTSQSSPAILMISGAVMVVLFVYRSIRSYRSIRR